MSSPGSPWPARSPTTASSPSTASARRTASLPAVGYNIFPPDIKWVNSLIPGGTSVSYGTSTPSSIYAEFIVEGRITDTGMICPEELPRSVRDAFIAELGVRNLPVTRKDVVTAN